MESKEKERNSNFTAKVSGDDYEPYIAPEEKVTEFTVRAVIIGCVLACLFGAANAYLAMKISFLVYP